MNIWNSAQARVSTILELDADFVTALMVARTVTVHA